MSELSRRGRRIEARTVGNGCSPDGATMYDGAMSYRCIVSDTQRLPGSLCRIHPSWMLIRSPITIGSLSPRTTDPNQILDPEPTTTFPMIVCTRRNPARRVDVRKKLIKLVGGHDAHPCYRGAPLAPSPSVLRKSVSTKSGRRSADQSWPQPSRLGADLRRTRRRCL